MEREELLDKLMRADFGASREALDNMSIHLLRKLDQSDSRYLAYTNIIGMFNFSDYDILKGLIEINKWFKRENREHSDEESNFYLSYNPEYFKHKETDDILNHLVILKVREIICQPKAGPFHDGKCVIFEGNTINIHYVAQDYLFHFLIHKVRKNLESFIEFFESNDFIESGIGKFHEDTNSWTIEPSHYDTFDRLLTENNLNVKLVKQICEDVICNWKFTQDHARVYAKVLELNIKNSECRNNYEALEDKLG